MRGLTQWFRNSTPAWRWISPEDLKAQLALAAPPKIVDVRGPDEFRGPEGHVPGALNRPMADLLANPTLLAQQAGPVVLICLTQIRSAKAADALAAAGVRNIAVLQGGMKAWNAAGLPVKR